MKTEADVEAVTAVLPTEEGDPEDVARKKLVDLRERREARDRKLQTQDEAREAEDLEILEGLEDEHGPVGRMIAKVSTPDGMVAVKRGAPLLFTRFQNSKLKTKDLEEFVYPTLIHPAIPVAKKLLEKYPGALTLAANKLSELYGASREEVTGKS